MRQHLLTHESGAPRLLASPALREHIAAQGRRLDWIAERLGVSKSFLSKVVARQSSISIADARVIAALIDGDVGALFELPDDTPAMPSGNRITGSTP